jgi:hypothetical protein
MGVCNVFTYFQLLLHMTIQEEIHFRQQKEITYQAVQAVKCIQMDHDGIRRKYTYCITGIDTLQCDTAKSHRLYREKRKSLEAFIHKVYRVSEVDLNFFFYFCTMCIIT